MAPTPAPPRPDQVATPPLQEIQVRDIQLGVSRVDAWLQSISGDVITLDRVKMVAGSLPVVGNIMALVDAIGDIITLVESKSTNPLDWVSLGMNLIGVIPAPPAFAPMRMGLRPVIAAARQNAARLAGELDKYVEDALKHLEPMLNDAAKKGYELCNQLAQALKSILDGKLVDSRAHKAAAQQALEVARKADWHKPDVVFSSAWYALTEFAKVGVMDATNAQTQMITRLIPEQAKAKLREQIDALNAIAREALAQLPKQASPNVEMGISWLLHRLLDALKNRRRTAVAAMVQPGQTAKASKLKQKGEIGVTGKEVPAHGDAIACKNGTCPFTPRSISFATGAERLSHPDFGLATVIPFSWERNYASNAGAYDHGPLGARWLGEWITRIEVRPAGKLIYWGADGRPVTFPALAVGQQHFHAVEVLTLKRLDATTLELHLSAEFSEVFELAPDAQFYRLRTAHWPNKHQLTLQYTHPHSALRSAPSDLVLSHAGNVQAHIRSDIDDAGRITALHLLHQDQILRTLAQYTYDESSDLVSARDEHGASWQYAYQRHLLTRYTDRTARAIHLRWDHATPSTQARAIREWADDGSFATALEWDPNIRLTYITDALGQETWHYYDIDGYTYRVIHPDGLEEWIFRDAAKNIVKHIHPDGSTDAFDWDARSRLLRHIRPDGSTHHFAYDDKDHVTTFVDGDGQHWKRDYDIAGQLSEETDPLGHKTAYRYNKAGLPTEVTDATGKRKTLAYTERGQLASYTDCSGKTSLWRYDPQGRISSFTDAAGAKTTYCYGTASSQATVADLPANHPGQLEAILHADESEERFVHDAEGRLLAHTDALNHTTTYTYTQAGLIDQRRDALGHTLRYQWDRLGRLHTLTNENRAEWTFQYDPVGRLLREIGFDGQSTDYGYEAATGTLAWRRQSPKPPEARNTSFEATRRLVTRFAFDPMGRLSERRAYWRDPQDNLVDNEGRPTSAEQPGAIPTESFAYDGNGRLALATNAHSRLQWFYDPAGRMVQEHQDYTRFERVAIWHHAYDALGNRTATTRPDGHRIDWQRYGSGHVHGILIDGSEHIGFERDDLHRETSRTQGNHLQQTREYDPLGRMLNQALKGLPGTNVQRRYEYDQAGQLHTIHDTRRGQLRYRYDPVGRLTEAHSTLGKEIFAFDPASNMLDNAPEQRLPFGADDTAMQNPRPGEFGTGKTTSKLLDNLLRDYAGQHNDYDGLGNLIQRTVHGEKTWFTWDPLGRLMQTDTRRDHHLRVGYAYDALGRRIHKHSQAVVQRISGDGPEYHNVVRERLATEHGYGVTLYGWDGDQMAWESALKGGHEASTTHYVYEPDSFVPLLQATTDDTIRLPHRKIEDGQWVGVDALTYAHPRKPTPFQHLGYYTCDHLGTPQEMTDQEGKLVWSAHYQAWGKAHELLMRTRGKAGITSKIRFQGQYYDHENGLHYNRYRYYDPLTGRYISKDPIGLLGGVNFYAYAGNNSVRRIDPLGLVDINLFPPSEAIQQSANNIPNPHETFTVGGHGNQSTMVDATGNRLTPKQLADQIKAHPNYKCGQSVTLMSCNTGKGVNPYAQKVATELTAPVSAPDQYLWIWPNGKTLPAGMKSDGAIDMSQIGSWRIFRP